jgi:hypothetical protein
VSLTTDPNDPRLGHGSDNEPKPQNEVYLVLSDEERAKGFVRPVYRRYVHNKCPAPGVIEGHAVTDMGLALCETYARDPKFYGATYCCICRMHRPVGEFNWLLRDGSVGPVVGT